MGENIRAIKDLQYVVGGN